MADLFGNSGGGGGGNSSMIIMIVLIGCCRLSSIGLAVSYFMGWLDPLINKIFPKDDSSSSESESSGGDQSSGEQQDGSAGEGDANSPDPSAQGTSEGACTKENLVDLKTAGNTGKNYVPFDATDCSGWCGYSATAANLFTVKDGKWNSGNTSTCSSKKIKYYALPTEYTEVLIHSLDKITTNTTAQQHTLNCGKGWATVTAIPATKQPYFVLTQNTDKKTYKIQIKNGMCQTTGDNLFLTWVAPGDRTSFEKDTGNLNQQWYFSPIKNSGSSYLSVHIISAAAQKNEKRFLFISTNAASATKGWFNVNTADNGMNKRSAWVLKIKPPK